MIGELCGASLWAEDNTTLVAFYRDVIGLKLLMVEGDNYTIFGDSVNRGWLGIGNHSAVSGRASDPYRHMIALGSTDVRTDYERLQAQGVEFIEAATDYGDGFWI